MKAARLADVAPELAARLTPEQVDSVERAARDFALAIDRAIRSGFVPDDFPAKHNGVNEE